MSNVERQQQEKELNLRRDEKGAVFLPSTIEKPVVEKTFEKA